MRKKYYGPATIKDYKGVEISVWESGTFHATLAGERLRADTLTELERQIDKVVKKAKVKVAVPVTELGWVWHERSHAYDGSSRWVHGVGVRHLTLTGIHANGNILARDDKTNTAEQHRFRFADNVVRRLTDVEVAQYVELYKAKLAAEQAYEAFLTSIKLPESLEDTIRQAVGEKIDTPDEPDAVLDTVDPRE